MPPSLAALIFVVAILGLFLLDRDRESRTSLVLWLPVFWLVLGGTRNVSEWFAGPAIFSADQLLEGSPLDRNILSGLMFIGLIVLLARRQRTVELLRRNAPLVVFFLFCAVSVAWSDYPFVALKRLTKVLGNVVMVLVVLTDPDPASSVKKFLTRTAFLLMPLSILFIRYYPEWGRYYDPWEGGRYFSGVAPDKNMLGAICLITGLGVVLRFVETFRETAGRARKFIAVGTVLAMTLYLLSLADSATSLGCFVIGGGLIAFLSLFRGARPWMVHSLVGSLCLVGLIAYTFPSAWAFLLESAGRDATLTGRTDLWDAVLSLDTHPWLGAGFESFFLGDRLDALWAMFWWRPNESHNGYLETYLTLGRIGLGLLGVLMVTGYRNAMNVYRIDPGAGSLRLALLIIASIYNLTEAAFRVMNPVWILFLLAVTALPDSQRQEDEQTAPSRVPLSGSQPLARAAWGRRPAPIVTALTRSGARQPAWLR